MNEVSTEYQHSLPDFYVLPSGMVIWLSLISEYLSFRDIYSHHRIYKRSGNIKDIKVYPDIRIRIRSGIVHIQMESTSIRRIIPITTSISNTRIINITVIAVDSPRETILSLSDTMYSHQRRRAKISCFDHITREVIKPLFLFLTHLAQIL